METLDPERLLAMLRDPNVESREIAEAAGVPREEAGRAARLVLGIAKAKPEEALTLPAPLAGAVARAAFAASRADLLAALAGHPGKDVAKEAKRGLHLLKSRGVAVPEPQRAAAPAVASPQPEPPLPAYASAIDGRGERAIWIPRILPGKGIEVAQAVVSDTLGLVELQLGQVGRKEWRALAKGLLSHGASMGVGEIDRERAKSLVVAARARNDASGQRVPESADLWLAQLGPAAPAPDPAASFPPLPEEDEREALAASAKLHDLPLVKSWIADEDYLRAVAAKLDEVAVSPLYIDERQRTAISTRSAAACSPGGSSPSPSTSGSAATPRTPRLPPPRGAPSRRGAPPRRSPSRGCSWRRPSRPRGLPPARRSPAPLPAPSRRPGPPSSWRRGDDLTVSPGVG